MIKAIICAAMAVMMGVIAILSLWLTHDWRNALQFGALAVGFAILFACFWSLDNWYPYRRRKM